MIKPQKTQVKRRTHVESPNKALDFLRAVTPAGINGTVVAIDPEKEFGEPGQIEGHAYTAETLDAAGAFITQHVKQRHNIYWSTNPTRTPLNKKPEKSDIDEMRYVHLDLDDLSEEALDAIREYPAPPTIIVRSGGGYNCYWELETPVHANGNINELEGVNRAIIMAFNADPGTYNLDRILRVPGTTNWPTKAKERRGRIPVEAVLLEHNPSLKYSLGDFPTATAQEYDAWKKSRKIPGSRTKGSDGNDTGSKVDRSKDLLRKVAVDISKGLDDDEIRQKYRTHAHAIDQADPLRAVQRCIDRVRADSLGEVEQVAAANALIFVSGKLLVAWPEHMDDGLPRLTTVADARNYWKKIQRGKVSPVDQWLSRADRTEYTGFAFRPDVEDTAGKLNLFQGWGVAPDPAASCELFIAHLRDIVCNGNEDLFDYVIQWFANMVQDPGNKPGTALAMSSQPGAGKGTVADYLSHILGGHLSRLSGPDQLLGRFNDTLAGKLMVFGDESAWPNDKRGMEKLKSYITEKRITVERKHIPALEIDNYCRFIFATNSKHSAPVEIDDRRFVVLNLNNSRRNDESYFKPIEAERLNGGPAAFLHYLLNIKLSRDLRTTPKTTDLAEQKLLSLDDVGQFVRQLLLKKKHVLDIGFNAETGGHSILTLEFGEVIGTDFLHRFYLDFAKRTGSRFPKSLDGLGVNIRRYFSLTKREPRKDEREKLKLGRGRGIQVYALPTLEQAREQFGKALGQEVPWPTWKEEGKNGQ